MRLNITEAAAMADVSRGTIYNHIRKGRVSAGVGEDGRKYIEVSELERVYGPLNAVDVQADVQSDIVQHVPDTRKEEMLRKQLEETKRRLEEKEQRLEETKQRLERAEQRIDVLLGVNSQRRLPQGPQGERDGSGENVETPQVRKRSWWPFKRG